MRSVPAFLCPLLLACSLSLPAQAYEEDVHYGLTNWLALKAGYLDWQAQAIAVGNVRVDSGTMTTLEVALDYACAFPQPEKARRIQQLHYPSAAGIPSDPEQREVKPGDEAARAPLAKALSQAKGQEALHLGILGSALHTLQDSWAHAGVPSDLSPGAGVRCDPRLASGPRRIDKAGPHAANHTFVAPADVLAMARASYDVLLRFPAVEGKARVPATWDSLAPEIQRFATTRTKVGKSAWFVAQGMKDTGFLADTTLPDGPRAFDRSFQGRELPPLPAPESVQHDAPADARKFFDQVFARWLGNEDAGAIVKDLGKAGSSAKARQRDTTPQMPPMELAARMRLWKLRDHGAAAILVHAPEPFTATQLAAAKALTDKPGALIPPSTADKALFALVTSAPNLSPLLPYILRELPRAKDSAPMAIAIARLKHAPRDTVGVVAKKTGDQWVLIDVVSVVDQ